jgi:hypothetical protein
VTDRDDVVRADEQMGLAVVDPAGGRIEMRGAKDDEDRVAVPLELGPLMRAGGVLDREVVKRELLLDLPEHLVVRLVEAHPHESTRLLENLADVGDRHLTDQMAARVRNAVDQSFHARPSPTSTARRPSKR